MSVSVWFQVEFYSELEERWVPLFAKFPTCEAALEKAEEVTPPRRVMKVTHTTENVAKSEGVKR